METLPVEPQGGGAQALPPSSGAPEASGKRLVKAVLVELLRTVVLALVLVLLLTTYIAQAYTVEGTSMQPLLENHQRLLVNKLIYRLGEIQREDVVVFWFPPAPDRTFIKRVIAIPGDTVEIRHGTVLVNGCALAEQYVPREYRDHVSFEQTVVPPGHYFVLGDHRNQSSDSRKWGFVPQRYILGRATICFWPPSAVGLIR